MEKKRKILILIRSNCDITPHEISLTQLCEQQLRLKNHVDLPLQNCS